MALVEESSKNELAESVYSIIKANSRRIRTADLDRRIGNKQDVRSAITRLAIMDKIKRVRGFSPNGVDYFYHDLSSSCFEKYRKVEMRMFARRLR